jgi:molybdate transport system substrate-binding protein
MELNILSGGAAQGVVKALQPAFESQVGAQLNGTFGAVGLMKEKLLAGAPCDVLILTAALIDELTAAGHAVAGTAVAMGRVKTGVAVQAGAPTPDVSSPDALKACLLQARGIYFPDPERATAGIHFVNVLRKLGIYEQVESLLRPFPNGATAMQNLAQSADKGLVGCTQVTEILYTPKVTLVGPLPKEFELATVYSAAVCARSAHPDAARELVNRLGGEVSREIREKGGFEF